MKSTRNQSLLWWSYGVFFLVASIILIMSENNQNLAIYSAGNAPLRAQGVTLMNETTLTPEALRYVEMGKENLGLRLNIRKEDMKVANVQSVEFFDTSLGCRQDGEFYTQVITPGYIITFYANGSTHVFRGGLGKVVSC